MLLCGPSGSGKSLVAARSGLPVLRLDDFYKEGDDPTLPLVEGSSDIDWDHPRSWDADVAVAAIAELCAKGRTTVPVYDIAKSARTGQETLRIDPSHEYLGLRLNFYVSVTVFALAIAAFIWSQRRPATSARPRPTAPVQGPKMAVPKGRVRR